MRIFFIFIKNTSNRFCMAIALMVDRIFVHYYERVDDEIVYAIFKKNLSDFDLFVKRVVSFLEK